MLYLYMIVISLFNVVLGDFYSSRYDDFDINPLLDNDRILLSYAKCFLDQGSCTPEGKDFKKVIPEALETSCGKCTRKQKQLIRAVVRALMERQPEYWRQLVDKYDPNIKFREQFNRFVYEDD